MLFEDAKDAWDLYNISPELTCTCDDLHICQQCEEEYKEELIINQSKTLKTMTPTFPDDFKRKMHPNIPGAKQWQFINDDEVIISVVGGGMGLYGDGIVTFEMYDFRENDVRGYLSKEEINEHLQAHPI